MKIGSLFQGYFYENRNIFLLITYLQVLRLILQDNDKND